LLDELLPPSAFRGDWRPGLRLELALKDLDLAEDLSRETEVEQHLLPTVRSLFEEARRHGWADLSAHAVLRLFEQSARVSYRSAVFEHPPED
jgi:3-hydroxyisobutyrate dehydrogenase-like beta-hydroxyacid dehydrogenase